mgnify:CR=1 FL=1
MRGSLRFQNRMVSHLDTSGIGARVSIYWDEDGISYCGTVREYNRVTDLHLVVYDDGEQRHEHLNNPALCWRYLQEVSYDHKSSRSKSASDALSSSAPPTAINLYVAERRAAIRLEQPTLNGSQVQQLALLQWKSGDFDRARKQELVLKQGELRRVWLVEQEATKMANRTRRATTTTLDDGRVPPHTVLGKRRRDPTMKARMLSVASAPTSRQQPVTDAEAGNNCDYHRCRDCGLAFASGSALGRHRRVGCPGLRAGSVVAPTQQLGEVAGDEPCGSCDGYRCHDCGQWFASVQTLGGHCRRRIGGCAARQKRSRSPGDESYLVESLLASRQMEGGRRQFLVRWAEYGTEDDSWEDEANILDVGLIEAFERSAPGEQAGTPPGEQADTPPVEQADTPPALDAHRYSAVRLKLAVPGDGGGGKTSRRALHCPFAGWDSSYASHEKLRRHLKCHREKKVVCEVCGKRFIEPCKLKRHMLVHTNERRFHCPVKGCDKTFGLAHNLRMHLCVHERKGERNREHNGEPDGERDGDAGKFRDEYRQQHTQGPQPASIAEDHVLHAKELLTQRHRSTNGLARAQLPSEASTLAPSRAQPLPVALQPVVPLPPSPPLQWQSPSPLAAVVTAAVASAAVTSSAIATAVATATESSFAVATKLQEPPPPLPPSPQHPPHLLPPLPSPPQTPPQQPPPLQPPQQQPPQQQLLASGGQQAASTSGGVTLAGASSMQKEPKVAVRAMACGECEACHRADCGNCRHCLGMLKFGGTGKSVQPSTVRGRVDACA